MRAVGTLLNIDTSASIPCNDWDDEAPTCIDLNAARPMRDLVYGHDVQLDAAVNS